MDDHFVKTPLWKTFTSNTVNFIFAKLSRNLLSKPIAGNVKSLNNWNIVIWFGKNWNRGIKIFTEMCATLQHPSSFPSSTPCRKTTGALTEICIQIGCPSFFFFDLLGEFHLQYTGGGDHFSSYSYFIYKLNMELVMTWPKSKQFTTG